MTVVERREAMKARVAREPVRERERRERDGEDDRAAVQDATVRAMRAGQPFDQSLRAPAVGFLQRHAGNAAVARALAAPRAAAVPGRWLARYEAGEHARFGSDDTVTVNGVRISKGNMIAMADFYGSPEAMNTATPEELTKLNDLVERDKKARTGVPGFTEVSNQEFEDATKGRPESERYMELNKANEGHFAPPKDATAAAESAKAGKDHKSLWERNHRKALDQAHRAAQQAKGSQQAEGAPPSGGGTPAPQPAPHPTPAPAVTPPAPKPPVAPGLVPPDATVTNMFGAHYLTDAFSSGHLINKAEIMSQAQTAWGTVKTEGWVYKENSFTKTVAQRVLADSKVKDKLKDKQLRVTPGVGKWGDVTTQAFSELLYLMSSFKGETFFNLFARIVHDVLNDEGVEVKNAKNQTWTLFGDEKLNDETLKIGKLAVEESEKNLQQAAKTSGDLDYQQLLKNVWDYVPQPTEKGTEFIEKVRRQFTDATDPKTVDRVVELSIKEIDIAILELEKAGHLRDKPKPERAKLRIPDIVGPLVAPGFGPTPWRPF